MLTSLAMLAMMQDPLIETDNIKHISPAVPSFEAPGSTFEKKLHNATVKIDKENAYFEITTLYRNPGSASISGKVNLAFYLFDSLLAEVTQIEAKWMDKPLELPIPRTTQARGGPVRMGEVSQQYGVYTYPATIPAKGSASFKVKYEVPLAKTGIDQWARRLDYRMAKTDQPYEQFQLSIKWEEKDVFHVLVAGSELGKFEVGKSGAFFKVDNKPTEKVTNFKFIFYPTEN